MVKKSSKYIRWIPSIAWGFFILVASGYPGSKLPEDPFIGFDKLVHVGIYAVLTFLISCSVRSSTPNKSALESVLIVLIGIIYGGFMELGQKYIFINRQGDWYDFFANGIGAVIGVFICGIYLRRTSNK